MNAGLRRAAFLGTLACATPLVVVGACEEPPPPFPFDIVPADAVVESDPVGKIDGRFSVSSAGTARYRVPLDLPEGRAGVQPSLALAYDSMHGNGVAGVGWSLSGLSTLARCAKTQAHDGATAPIGFDDSDRYCLDGERLVGVGQDEYRTERNPFERIVALDPDGLGPTRFRVFARDGRVLEYGGTPESRVEGTRAVGWTGVGRDRVRHSWALSRVEDRSGNWMAIDYQRIEEADSSVEQIPIRIRYTGHSSGIAPLRRIEIRYDRRPDDSIAYVAGLRVRSSQRIGRIEAWAPDGRLGIGLVRAWELDYRNDSVTRRSLLSELRECDGAGVCKPPTTFEWDLGSLEHGEIRTGIFDVASDPDGSWLMSLADLNGDGATELIYPVVGETVVGWYVRPPTSLGGFGDRSGAFIPPPWTSIYGPDGPPQWLDFDADGDLELLARFRPRPEAGFDTDLQIWDWTGIQFAHVPDGPESLSIRGPNLLRFADLDGNGAIDVIDSNVPGRGARIGIHARFHDGAQWADWSRVGHFARWDDANAIDIDDDRAVEVIEAIDDRDRFAAAWFRPGERARERVIDLEVSRCRMWADINGDGLADSVVLEGGAPRIQVNTGRGFAPSTSSVVLDTLLPDDAFDACPHQTPDLPRGIIPVWRHPVHALDFDGDGRTDLLDVSTMTVLLSRGQLTGLGGGLALTHPFSFEMHALGIATEGSRTPTGWPRTAVGDVNGDGLPDIVQVAGLGPQLRVHPRLGSRADLLERVTDGFGAYVSISHAPMIDAGTYSPGTGCDYPVRCVRGGGHTVVSAYAVPDGLGGERRFSFVYSDARMDITGRGWLGFGRRKMVDHSTGAVIETEYGARRRVGGFYPLAGTVERETATVHDAASGVTHVEVRTQVHAPRLLHLGSTYVTQLLGRDVQQFEVHDGRLDTEAPIRRHRSAFAYDDYGNRTFASTTSDSGLLETTETGFENRDVPWLIGLPVREVRVSQLGGEADRVVRTFRHDTLGRLVREKIEPDSFDPTPTPPDLSDPYDRDTNRWTLVERGADGVVDVVREQSHVSPERVTRLDWDAERVYPRCVTNPMGHVTRTVMHPGLGVPVVLYDENGVETRIRVDGFGRRREEILPDGRRTTFRYLRSTIRVENAEGAVALQRHDVFGRPLQEQWEDSEGRTIAVSREWDHLGRLHKISRPHFVPVTPDSPVVWVEVERDVLGRPTRVPSPRMDGTASIRYAGLEVSVVDARGVARVRREDGDGRMIELVEPREAGGVSTTRYRYGAFGRLRHVTDAAGNVTSYEWDDIGRPTARHDPDSGTRLARFDPFGGLVEVTDAEGETTTFARDLLGRTLSSTGSDGTTIFEWDLAEHGVGSLWRSESPDSVATEHAYDELGRASSMQWQIRIGEAEVVALRMGVAYDSAGRVSRLDYPDADGAHPFSVHHRYDARGLLTEVLRSAGATAPTELVWEASARDAEDRVTAELFGNAVTTTRDFDPESGFLERLTTRAPDDGPLPGSRVHDLLLAHDPHGHVSQIVDPLEGREEVFRYDSHDRLSSAEIKGEELRRFAYDDIGNLILHDGVEQAFGELGAGPHQVTSAGGQSYRWDDNGRNVEGPGRTIEWTSFDLPRSMRTGPNAERTDYRYDAFQNRVARSGAHGQVLYLPGLYERRREDGFDTYVWYVAAGGRHVAQVTWHDTTATERIAYLHHDQAGSVALATDDAADVVHRARYRPFGQRIPIPDAPTSDITRGFGGHEEGDPSELVNMGGRIYDPAVGRFLSTDPLQVTPFATPALDPYAYVYNDPLTLTDPTGFQAEASPDGGWHLEGSLDGGFYAVPNSPTPEDPVFEEVIYGDPLPSEGGALGPNQIEPGVFDGWTATPPGAPTGLWAAGERGVLPAGVPGGFILPGPAVESPGGDPPFFAGHWGPDDPLLDLLFRWLFAPPPLRDDDWSWLFAPPSFRPGGDHNLLAQNGLANLADVLGERPKAPDLEKDQWVNGGRMIAGAPNPWGRLGSPAHRAVVLQARVEYEAAGWTTLSGGGLRERAVQTPNGIRYPDLVVVRGGERVAVQVGRQTSRGVPVVRERRAIWDLMFAESETFTGIFFRPY